jgi:hypothetical protein
MLHKQMTVGVVAAALLGVSAAPATAVVLDAVYRGTLVCDKLPFTEAKMREAIEVTIAGGQVKYRHIVRLRDEAEPRPEEGAGKLDGQRISLQGSWREGAREYEAKYSGTFIRRSARLRGSQSWNVAGKTLTRACTGAIKRPLKAFLPRKKRPVTQ